ncbi:MAG: RDD family protein [Methylomonas sp.]|jgi:uncharacterized RDD family membrane protein YckC
MDDCAPGFRRRLAAICYDALLLAAVLFLAAALILPFNAGQAVSAENSFHILLYRSYLLLVCFIYYGWFWVNGGQTPGLRAWSLKVATFDGRPLSWRQAFLRFATAVLSWACLGAGFLWSLFDKHGLCWHDYLSKTRPYLVNREK